jgi:hypothetical protein
MSRTRIIAFWVFLSTHLLFGIPLALSQTQDKQAPQPTGLVLEVTYYKGLRQSYQTVARADLPLAWVWYAHFPRIPNWQTPPEKLPVKAVKIASGVEGDAVRVNVSVFVGKRNFDKEEQVANFLLRENQTASVGELEQHGVSPFEIKVVRVLPVPTILPTVVNMTTSVEVLSLEANHTTLPSFKLKLRNLSTKNIRALDVRLMVSNRVRLSSQRHDKENRTLIEAGGVYETDVSGVREARSTPDGYVPGQPPEQSILINTAVFEDGTYEGEAKPATEIRARDVGKKIQVARIAALLKKSFEAREKDARAALLKLKTEVSALSVDIDPRALDALVSAFPALNEKAKNEMLISAQVSLHYVRKELLDEIDKLEKDVTPDSTAAFLRWLDETKERYEEWLSRF